MNAAAVGFQCPECVREGRRGQRSAVTAFGAAVSIGNDGLLTRVLIGINVAVWLLTVAVALLRGEVSGDQLGQLVLYGGLTDLVQWGAALPAVTGGSGLMGGIASGELWRLATAMFLHYGIIHLALNMYALWILGRHCESLLGRWRFLTLYLLSGLGGTIAEFVFRSPNTYAVGASGCIFGLMAALFFFFRKLNIDVRPIVVLLGLNLVLGLFLENISLVAHVAGMVTGGALGAILAYAPRGQRQSIVQLAGVCAVALILLTFTAVRITQYDLWPSQRLSTLWITAEDNLHQCVFALKSCHSSQRHRVNITREETIQPNPIPMFNCGPAGMGNAPLER
ncbi:MAG: rhomboid family intramembrane serine protease [Acidimicrobiales bacterium]|nr:MAG: rhomboid family intramembrane serine protease [Acidimicrobiales bacterium]